MPSKRVLVDRRRKPSVIRVDGDVAYVEATRGQFALIDADDVPLVEGRAWSARFQFGFWRIRTTWRVPSGLAYADMSTLILPRREGFVPDHRDGDPRNNRRSNLRYATHAQNQANTRSANPLGKGVSLSRGRYRATIGFEGRATNLGTFATSEEAAAAYRRAAEELYGEFAYHLRPEPILPPAMEQAA